MELTTLRVCSRRAYSRTSKALRAALDVSAPRFVGMTEDQEAYFDVAKNFSANELAPFADEWDAEKHFPKETLRAAAALGFGGLYVGDDVGGSGLSRQDGLPIIEALAGGCTSTTAYLTIHNMVAGLVDVFGNDEQRQRLLPQLCTMEHMASYCLTEPGAGSDAANLSTRAKLSADGESYVLTGEKAFISGGGTSDIYMVMARTGDGGASGISCFIVEAADAVAKGTLSFGANEKKLGWNSQPTAAVVLDEVVVPASNRIAAEGDGFKIAMKGLDGGRLSIGCCSTGAAQTCFDKARAYVGGREQFGAPLSVNQSVQFKLAEMATSLTTSRLLLRHAAGALDEKRPEARELCAMAKKQSTDAGFAVCNEALQLHGGYGYLRDYEIERFLRDVRVHQILEGTNEIMSVIIGRELTRA